ncbi:hypothetical protein IGB42_00949 [Andreprevotia sp. IGB-42]|uniref:cupin n=1 Tax=Andreprevotia sp. IGB-42 TaxID=2497473 RepID=UPI00135A3502|nr:cupin [Andreprevotia sp. IGB-42]KAF0814893.1 hypothetical protein IGB42_00949 [Andreprevotia sp. IGB-42]
MQANLLHPLPDASGAEVFETLLQSPHVRIERIVSDGQVSPEWYDQAETEWVLLLAGAARLLFEGDATETQLLPGDHVLIEPHRRHRVTYTAPQTVWLAVWATDGVFDPAT